MFKKIAVIIKKIRVIRVIRVQKNRYYHKKNSCYSSYSCSKKIAVVVKGITGLEEKEAAAKRAKNSKKRARSVLHIYAFLPLFLAAF